MEKIPYGYCNCGCGNKTKLYTQNCFVAGKECFKGFPKKYLYEHKGRGENCQGHRWKGGRTIDSHGYVFIRSIGHPRVNKTGAVQEHILICEKVLGKYLPTLAAIHHVDGNRSNNVNKNLVICENNAYHQLLHKRTNAYNACGHASWEKCQHCKQYDKPENLVHGKRTKFHKECERIYRRELNTKL
jgi:hypothetical protein